MGKPSRSYVLALAATGAVACIGLSLALTVPPVGDAIAQTATTIKQKVTRKKPAKTQPAKSQAAKTSEAYPINDQVDDPAVWGNSSTAR